MGSRNLKFVVSCNHFPRHAEILSNSQSLSSDSSGKHFFEKDSGDVASGRLKHARFGNIMTVSVVVETDCAQADKKNKEWEEGELKKKKCGGGALKDRG